MKLYTEEQVRMLDINCGNSTLDEVIGCLTPIELPSDEEIEEIGKDVIIYNDTKRGWFIEGLKFMRNKIKGDNNEQQ